MKKMIMILCSIVMFSAVADAVCLTASLAATAPATDFTNNNDGTITHNRTGLMWKQCTEGLSGVNTCATGTATQYTWQAALQAAETLNNGGGFAGLTDWRMPNIKELDLIVEHQCSVPSIDATIFPATAVANSYWSTTLYNPVQGNMMGKSFNDGQDAVTTKATTTLHLRLVRGGL